MKRCVSVVALLLLAIVVSVLVASCDEVSVEDYRERFNQYRQEHGLSPLTFTDDLNQKAELRLEELKRDFSHSSLGGYNNHLGENIVKGTYNNRSALATWDESLGHRANMLDTSYRYSGYAAGGGYAVQLFTQYLTVNGEPQLPPGWHWDE